MNGTFLFSDGVFMSVTLEYNRQPPQKPLSCNYSSEVIINVPILKAAVSNI